MQSQQTAVTDRSKSVYFSPQIDRYFAHWILPGTWFKGNPQDDKRFYLFVKALHVYDYEHKFDESYLREKIINFVVRKHKFKKETAEEYVSAFVSRANDILYFLKDTDKFPIQEIDEWNPPLEFD